MERVRVGSLVVGMIVAGALLLTAGEASAEDPGAGYVALADGDFFAARKGLASAAEDGDPVAQYTLGILFLRGLGGDRDHAAAFRNLSPAGLHPFRRAQVALGRCYRDGIGVGRDDQRAADLFEEAARAGDLNGVVELGRCLAGGRGRKQDAIEAFAWFLTAAKSGSREAAALLGRVILDFEFTDADKRAGEQRQQVILEALKKSMAEFDAGKHVTFDFSFDEAIEAAAERAFELYEQGKYAVCYPIYLDLADSHPGHASSMFYVARMHERGRGREQDLGRAVEWYRRSALGGERAAYENLAWLYDDGQGVPVDRAMASRLFEAAAYRGWWSAQTEAARRMAAGIGYDDFDPALALAFLTIAIEEGKQEDAVKLAQQLSTDLRVTEEHRRRGAELSRKIRENIANGRFPSPPAGLETVPERPAGTGNPLDRGR